MTINLENRVGEITLALGEKGIKANVHVKNGGLVNKKQEIYIIVNGINETESKKNCVVINETLLDMIGYGTISMDPPKDGVLYVTYTPIRDDKPKNDRDYTITPGAK